MRDKDELDQPVPRSVAALPGAPNDAAAEQAVSANQKRGEPSGRGSPQSAGRGGEAEGKILISGQRNVISLDAR